MKGDQTITFAALADRPYGDPPFTVVATGGASGNAVTFGASGACEAGGFNGATITILAAGLCTVTASQAGSDLYNAAADVVRTFTVIDAFAPTAGPTQSPSAVAGWNNTDVTVTWNWTDAGGSGIDPANCTTSSTSAGEGTAIVLGATCKDLAGNTGTASYSVMVDKTLPIVALTGGPAGGGSYYFGAVPGAPTCSASDALSGLAGCAISGYSTVVGSHTVIATAMDRAGNVKTASATYTVLPWTFRGFYQPVDMGGVWNTIKGGSTVTAHVRSLRRFDRVDEPVDRRSAARRDRVAVQRWTNGRSRDPRRRRLGLAIRHRHRAVRLQLEDAEESGLLLRRDDHSD